MNLTELPDSGVRVGKYLQNRWRIIFTWKNKRHFIYKNWDGTKLNEHNAERLKVRITYDMTEHKDTFDPESYKHTVKNFDRLVLKWVKESTCGQDHKRTRERMCNNFFILHFKKLDVPAIRKKEIEDFFKSLKEKGLAAKTVNNIMHELGGFFHWLERENLITKIPPFPKLEKVPKRKIEWYTREDHKQLYEFCTEPVFRFLRCSGARPNEARGLQKADIDWNKRCVSILHALPETGFKVKGTKTNSHLAVDFFDELEESLRAGMESSPKNCSFVFTKGGKPYTRRILQTSWMEMTKRAQGKYNNLPRLSLYEGTKHSRAMQMLNEEGRSLSDVQEALGHVDIQSTKHYAEMLPGRRADLLSNGVTQKSHKTNSSESQEKLVAVQGFEPRTLRI